MKIIALDLSKANSGMVGWDGQSPQPIILSHVLGSELTKHGMVFARLHGHLNDLAQILGGVDVIYVEEPLMPQAIQRHTTFQTIYLSYGLAAHADSYAAAKSCRIQFVNQTNWRAHFIGKMKRGTKTKEFKEYAMDRCRQLGLKARNFDEADALGVLDYACDLERIMPPWRAGEVLRPPL